MGYMESCAYPEYLLVEEWEISGKEMNRGKINDMQNRENDHIDVHTYTYVCIYMVLLCLPVRGIWKCVLASGLTENGRGRAMVCRGSHHCWWSSEPWWTYNDVKNLHFNPLHQRLKVVISYPEKKKSRECWEVYRFEGKDLRPNRGGGGRFLFAPREARLQFALLPSMTGDGFWHARMAASGSLNVTLKQKTGGWFKVIKAEESRNMRELKRKEDQLTKP